MDVKPARRTYRNSGSRTTTGGRAYCKPATKGGTAMNELKNRIAAIEEAMKRCRPGKDFPRWKELNKQKSALENELHRMRVLAASDEEIETRSFYKGINKARHN